MLVMADRKTDEGTDFVAASAEALCRDEAFKPLSVTHMAWCVLR
jgi:hypothetical protein